MNLPGMFCLRSEGSGRLSVKKTMKVHNMLVLTSKFILDKTVRRQKVLNTFPLSIKIVFNGASFSFLKVRDAHVAP